MFTGLIEKIGLVRSITPKPDGGAQLQVDIDHLSQDCSLGDSIAINGCCLTVVQLKGTIALFDAVPETLSRTNLGTLKSESKVNLERALLPDKRLGGHFVQGHIDGTATVVKTVAGGKWAEWHFKLDNKEMIPLIVEKGSIALDGISLTVAGCDAKGSFWVALIPETLARTTLPQKLKDAKVNVETDILGKYVQAMLTFKKASPENNSEEASSKINTTWLKERGF